MHACRYAIEEISEILAQSLAPGFARTAIVNINVDPILMLIWPETNDVATDLGRAIRRRMYRISKGLNNSAASRECLSDGLLFALSQPIHNFRDLFHHCSIALPHLLF